MELFEFMTKWRSFSHNYKESLKRSVLIFNSFNSFIDDHNLYDWGFRVPALTRMDEFMSFFHFKPVFLENICVSEIEKCNTFLINNYFSQFRFNQRGELLFQNQVFNEIPMPEEDINLFHEIINLPIYLSKNNYYSENENLNFLNKLKWICCYDEKNVINNLLNSFNGENIIGLVLSNCDLNNLDHPIFLNESILYLNISNNYVHPFDQVDFDENYSKGYLKQTGLRDLSVLYWRKFEMLDISENKLINNLDSLEWTSIGLLNCINTSIDKSDVDKFKKNNANSIVIENAQDNSEEFGDIDNDFNGNYPTDKDAFDDNDQYNDWLNR